DWIAPTLQGMKVLNLLQPFEKDHFQVIRADSHENVQKILGHIEKIEKLLQEKNMDFVDEPQKLELINILILINGLKHNLSVQFNHELDDKYDYVQQVVRYIDQNFQNKVTLDDIANELSI